jgi:PRTRC genetic system protein C
MSIMVLPRRFKYNQLQLDDPDVNMSPESVKEFYSGIYPELTQAVVEGPEVRDNGVEYSFRRAVGTKGREQDNKSKEDGKRRSQLPIRSVSWKPCQTL